MALSTTMLTLQRDQRIEPAKDDLVILASGWIGLVRHLSDGRRQIVSVLLPGDIIVLREDLALKDCQFVALSKVEVASVASSFVLKEGKSVLERGADRINGHILDHVLRLGLLSSYERAGHFLLECQERLSLVGLANAGHFLMPLSQKQLGEVMGVTSTHINRTLRQLRQDGFLTMGPGWLHLANIADVAQIMRFRDSGSELPAEIG